MLDKLSGKYAPRPSPGPHKLRECLPLVVLLRNRLKYALTRREVMQIVKQRLIKVDGKARTDSTFPAGFMDVVSIEKTGEHFRILYDTKARFALQRVSAEDSKFKLCRVKKLLVGSKGIPYIVTHDGRTIRYPDPLIRASDTVKVYLATGKVTDFVKFETGNVCMITGGHNMGRVGTVAKVEKHAGSYTIVHVTDATGNTFATRLANVFVLGKGKTPLVSLPRNRGIRLSILEEREKKFGKGQ